MKDALGLLNLLTNFFLSLPNIFLGITKSLLSLIVFAQNFIHGFGELLFVITEEVFLSFLALLE